MNQTMRKGGVAEGRNLPPPFHGPQQLETIYYHHGYPIVSISFMTNDIIYRALVSRGARGAAAPLHFDGNKGGTFDLLQFKKF